MITEITIPDTATPTQRAAIVTAVVAACESPTAATTAPSQWGTTARLEQVTGTAKRRRAEPDDLWTRAGRRDQL